MESKLNVRYAAIRYGFLALLAGLLIFFSIFANGFAGPRSAVFIFQSVAITGIPKDIASAVTSPKASYFEGIAKILASLYFEPISLVKGDKNKPYNKENILLVGIHNNIEIHGNCRHISCEIDIIIYWLSHCTCILLRV